MFLCGYQKIKDDTCGSHPISIGQHYLYDICLKNNGQDADKPKTPPRQENGGQHCKVRKGKLGAKIKVGGGPEPVQNGWVGVNLNIPGGGRGAK